MDKNDLTLTDGASSMEALLSSVQPDSVFNAEAESRNQSDNNVASMEALIGISLSVNQIDSANKVKNMVAQPEDFPEIQKATDSQLDEIMIDGRPLTYMERKAVTNSINSKLFNVAVSSMDMFNSIATNASKLLPKEYQIEKDLTQLQLKAIDKGMGKIAEGIGAAFGMNESERKQFASEEATNLEAEYLKKKKGINTAGDLMGAIAVGNVGFNLAVGSGFAKLDKAKEALAVAKDGMIKLAQTGKFTSKTGVNPFWTTFKEYGKANLVAEAAASTAYWNHDIFKPANRNFKQDIGILAGANALAAGLPAYRVFKSGRAAITEANNIAQAVRNAEGVAYTPMELFSRNRLLNSANTTVLGNNIKWLEEKASKNLSGFYDELTRTKAAARLSVGGLVKGNNATKKAVLDRFGNVIDNMISENPNSFYGVDGISEVNGLYNSAKEGLKASRERVLGLRVKAAQSKFKGNEEKAGLFSERADKLANQEVIILKPNGQKVAASQYWLPERLADGSSIKVLNPKGDGVKAPMVIASSKKGGRVSIDLASGTVEGAIPENGDLAYAAFNELEKKVGLDKLESYKYIDPELVNNWYEADWIAKAFNRDEMSERAFRLKSEYLDAHPQEFQKADELFEQTFGMTKEGVAVNRFDVDGSYPLVIKYDYNKYNRVGANEAYSQSLKMVENANAKRLADLKAVGEGNEIVASASKFVESDAYKQFRENIDLLNNTEFSSPDMFSQRQFLFKDKALKPLFQGLNKLKTETASKINAHLEPLKSNLSNMLLNSDDTRAFSEFAHMSRMGFVIKELGNGQAIIDVAKSDKAFKRLEQLIGKAVPRTDYLPGMNGQPLTFSKAVEDSLNLWNETNKSSINAMYKLRGWNPEKARNFHFPPKNLNKKNVTFLYEDLGNGNTGELVSVVASDYDTNFKNLLKKEKQLYGRPLVEVKKDTKAMQDVTSLDEAKWVDMDDYTQAVKQNMNKGEPSVYRSSVGNIVNDGAEFVNEVFDGLQRQAFSLSNTALIKGAAPELKYLNSIADQSNLSMSGVGAAIEMLTGRTVLGKDSGFIKVLNSISEGIVDATEAVTNTVNNLRNFSQKKFADEMNRYVPSEIAKFSAHGVIGGLSKWANKAYLMWGNMQYALVNGLGLPTSVSLWANCLKRLPNESARDHQNRIGIFGKVVDDFVIPDIQGTIGETIKDMVIHPKEFGNWLDWAKDNSVIDEAVAEYFRNGYGISAGSTFNKMADSIDKWISSVASASDQGAKTLAAKIGYDIGKKGGLEGDTLVLFSRQASDLIAGNYTMLNKPTVARNEFGALNYTFMTYAQGMTERLLESIGNKQHRAFLAAMASNALIFGTNSIPGMDSIKYLSGYKKEGKSLYADISKEYGDNVARLFAYGGWGALTGTDLSRSGSIADTRLPFIRNPSDLVGVQLLNRGLTNISELVSEVKRVTSDGISGERVLNILSMNGFPAIISNSAKAVQGYSIDSIGGISEEYRNDAERIMAAGGFRTIRETESRNLRSQSYEARMLWKERQNSFSKRLRALIREGDYKGVDTISRLGKEWLDSGGNIIGYSRFIEAELKNGLQNRVVRDLINNPKGAAALEGWHNLFKISTDQMEFNEEGLE